MATRMTKPITRMTDCTVPWRGAARKRLVVTLYPNGALEMRPEKQRSQVEIADLEGVYQSAVIRRVAAERAARKTSKRSK